MFPLKGYTINIARSKAPSAVLHLMMHLKPSKLFHFIQCHGKVLMEKLAFASAEEIAYCMF